MTEQMNMFECLYPPFKTDKKLRLIELFAGYGSQALALKYLGLEFEHWKICEWNYKSFQAYKGIHMPDDHKDYSKSFPKEFLVECLADYGISANWNEPMKAEQIKRLNESKLKEIYNNIQSTHNLVDVSKIHANDLQIINKDLYTYILTYSFPCQDLSLAGQRAGMSRDSETRSSLLWQVERILQECKEQNCLPDILLMENVPQVHGTENMPNFREWLTELERLGYQSYWQDLIATDYGIPQIRNRTFCVSLLGEYSYNFPVPITLNKRLKDLLEEKVAHKYYLSDTLLKNFIVNEQKRETTLKIKNATKQGYLEAEEGDCIDITTRPQNHRGTVQKGKAQTLSTLSDRGGVVNETKVVNSVASRGRGENNTQRLEFGGENANALTTVQKDSMVAISNSNLVDMGDYYQGHIKGRLESATRYYKTNAAAPTLNTCGGGGLETKIIDDEIKMPRVVGGFGNRCNNNTQWHLQNRIYDGDVATTTTTAEAFQPNYIDNNLRIRKLTPRECFRLMGVKDDTFERVQEHASDSTLYHLAGDSIVTTCLMAIFGKLLGIEWQEKVKEVWPK